MLKKYEQILNQNPDEGRICLAMRSLSFLLEDSGNSDHECFGSNEVDFLGLGYLLEILSDKLADVCVERDRRVHLMERVNQ